MHPFLQARFYLVSITRQQHYSSEIKHSTNVKFAGVQGEPFGSATPQANLEMLIVNPEAQKALHALHPGQKVNVYFELVEE